MARLKGRFYFKCTSIGNLLGEFSNNIAPGIYTESADLNINDKKGEAPFIGSYTSTWQEDGIPKYATLIIGNNHKPNPQIYSLTWTQEDKTIYWGEGILFDNILMGNYRNHEKD